jgi:hypothetical protein
MVPEEGIDFARSAALGLARDHYAESLTRKVCICSNLANSKPYTLNLPTPLL